MIYGTMVYHLFGITDNEDKMYDTTEDTSTSQESCVHYKSNTGQVKNE
jgi:hypothetical protein